MPANSQTPRENLQEPNKFQQLFEKLQRTRLMRAQTNLGEKGGEIYAAGMSFQALFAVFGAMFVAFSIFGVFLRGNTVLLTAISDSLSEFAPGLVGEGGAINLEEVVNSSAVTWSGLIGAASLVMLVITWFTSTRTVIRVLNNLDIKSAGNAILLKLQDLGMALLFGLLILVSSAAALGTTAVLDGLKSVIGPDSWLFGGLGFILRYGVMLLIYWFVVFAIHKWLAKLPYANKELWIGTLPGGIGLLVLTLLGSSLLGGATKNPLLASFAVIIGLLLWFNFICRVLLFTASWVAAGADPQLGLPEQLLEKDRAAAEKKEIFAAQGLEAYSEANFETTELEPAARWRGQQ